MSESIGEFQKQKMLILIAIIRVHCQANLNVRLVNSQTLPMSNAKIEIKFSGFSGPMDFTITGAVTSDDIPIICQDDQITTITDQPIVIDRFNCQSFRINILQQTSTPFTLNLQSYQIYLGGFTIQLKLNIFYAQVNVEKNYDFTLTPLYQIFMLSKYNYTVDYQFIVSQSQTGSQSSLWFTYRPLTYLVADSYMLLNLQFRDIYNTPATIPMFNTQSPLCIGLIGVNSNISCQVKGSQLYVYNLVSQTTLLQNMTLMIYNFTTSQALQTQINPQIQFFNRMALNYFQLQKSPPITIKPQTINSNVQVQFVQTSDIVSQQNTITFQILYQDFLYDWTNIILIVPSNYQSNLASLTIIPQANMKPSPAITQTGNQIIINKCLSQFLNSNQQISFSINTNNPDLVNQYDGFKILLQDGNQLQNIAQSPDFSLKTQFGTLQNVQIIIASQKVGILTSYTFQFYCNTNLPVNTYLQIIFSSSIQFQSNGQVVNCSNVNQGSQLVIQNLQLTINKWADSQIITQNTQRAFTITNIRNPIRMQDNIINYQLIVYQSDNQIHDYKEGQLILTLEQSQFQILSCQFMNQTSNTVSDLTITFSSEGYLYQYDQLIIKLNVNDFAFSLMKTSIICKVNQQLQSCFESQGQIYIIMQSSFTTYNYSILVQNHVNMRSLKQSSLQLLLRRAGYQVSESNQFVFQNQQASNFLEFKQIEAYQSPNYTYKYFIKSQLSLQIGEILEISLPSLYNNQSIEISFNASFSVKGDILSLKLEQELQPSMTYYVLVQNGDAKSSQTQAVITSKTQDNFIIQYSIYYVQPLNNYPKILPKFTNHQDNQYINTQNSILFTFQSNFNLTDGNYGILTLPIDIQNISDIQLNYISINYTLQSNLSNHIINFNFTNNADNQDILLSVWKIVNPKLTGIRFTAFIDIYDSIQLLETGMTILDSYICNNNCQQCDENSNCIKCQNFWYLRDHICVQQCQQQDIIVGLECIACNVQSPCRYCNQNNKNECSLCQGDLILNDGVCVNQQYNQTKEQEKNNTVILKPIISNQESLFDKLYYSLFLYFNAIVLLLFIIRKVIRRKFRFVQGYLSYIGICDPIAHLISLISFMISNQKYQCYVSGGLLLIRMIYLINSQIIIIPQLQTEKMIQRLIYKSNALKLILALTKFYDWKISFILNSKLSQKQVFCLKYNNQDQINRNYSKILQWSFIYVNPLNILILILSVSTDQYNTSVFQFEYLIFLLISQMFSITKTYQYEMVKGSNIFSEETIYQ